MTSPQSPIQAQHSQEKQKLKRLMAQLLVGSSLLHGLAIALVTLKSEPVKESPPLAVEIVVDEEKPVEKPKDETATTSGSSVTTTSGSSGGDETLQVATLNPSSPAAAETSPDPTPIAQPEEISDQDLAKMDLTVPILPKKKPNSASIGPTEGENNNAQPGTNNGSNQRGLAQTSGQGPGTGNTPNGNNGDGNKGQGSNNDGGLDKKTTTPASPTPMPKPSPTSTPKPSSTPMPKPSEAPVAIAPKPSPPVPSKPEPPINSSFEDQEGERIAAGTTTKVRVKRDAQGRLVPELLSTTGDAELDAAQLRSIQRSLDSDPELREQIEANAGKTFKMNLEGEGETDAEREQIRRNREIMSQQESPAEPPAATAVEPAPVEPPVSDPQPEAPAYEAPPAPIDPPAPTPAEPVYEAPPAAVPEPVYEEPIAPAEPPPEAPPAEPVEAPPVAPVEPPPEAPVESPPEPSPAASP